MSPVIYDYYRTLISFPRVSGDEPARARDNTLFVKFSPRERG